MKVSCVRSRTSFRQEEQQHYTDESSAYEQASLSHVHPYDCFHTPKEGENDDGYSEYEDDCVDIDVKEGRECHGDEEEDCAGLGKMSESECK